MTRDIIHFTVLSLVLLLAQVVCNRIMLFGVAMPLVYIYVIMRLPIRLNSGWVLTIAFALGLIVDVFNNTPGMNTMACTVIAAMRRAVFDMFAPHDLNIDELIPSSESLGIGVYSRYLIVLTVVFTALLFLVQAFTLRDWLLTLERTAASSVLSIIVMLGIDSLIASRHEQEL